MVPRSFVVALGLLGPMAIGCSGIFGLQETSEREVDASSGGQDAAVDSTSSDSHAGPETSGDSASPDAGDALPEAQVEAGPDGPVYTTSPTSVVLVPDASVGLAVNVTRNGTKGPLAISLSGLPTGVTSTMGTIAADAGSTTVTVSAAPTAPVGSASSALDSNGAKVGTVPVAVNGAPGTLDTSFGGGFLLDMQDPGAIFNAVAVDAASGILVGGTSNSGAWLIRRYLTDGTSDATFTANVTAAVSTHGSLDGMILDPSTGNIICVGQDSSNNTLTVIVLDGSGHIDGSFNNASPFALNPNFFTPAAGLAVVLSAPHTITVVGQEQTSPSMALVTWALPLVGSPPNNNQQKAFVGPTQTTFTAVGISQGRVVAAGSSTNIPGWSPLPVAIVQRFDGGVGADPTFGDAGGMVTGIDNCQVQSLAVLPHSGNVLVAGANEDLERGCFVAWSPAGVLLYEKGGTQGFNSPFTYWGAALMNDPGDHVYLVGSGGDGWTAELARMDGNAGTYDPTFGNAGHATFADTAYPANYEYTPKAVAVQADGRVVIAGQKWSLAGTNPFLARFWP